MCVQKTVSDSHYEVACHTVLAATFQLYVSEGVSLSMHCIVYSFYTYCDNGFGTGQLRMEYKSAISDG